MAPGIHRSIASIHRSIARLWPTPVDRSKKRLDPSIERRSRPISPRLHRRVRTIHRSNAEGLVKAPSIDRSSRWTHRSIARREGLRRGSIDDGVRSIDRTPRAPLRRDAVALDDGAIDPHRAL
jgi:hypothetical protein